MTEDLRNEAHVALQDKTPLMRLNIGKKIKIGNKIRSRVLCDSSRTYRIWGFSSADGGERMGVGRKRRKFHLMAGASRRHFGVASQPLLRRPRQHSLLQAGRQDATSEVTIWKLQLQLRLCSHENTWQTTTEWENTQQLTSKMTL